MTPDEKIRWLLDRDLIFDHEAKHEVFTVLKLALPESTPNVRALLLERTIEGPKFVSTVDEAEVGEQNERLEQLAEYTTYNALNWFTKVAPDWAEAVAAQTKMQHDHLDFGPRDNPDFDHFMTSGEFGVNPPKSAQEMIEFITKEGADAALIWLLAQEYSEHRFDGPDWDSALSLIRAVVTIAPTLGIDLWDAPALTGAGDRRTSIIASILSGWAAATTALPWAEILDRADSLFEGGDQMRELTDLLLALAKDEQSEVALPDVLRARNAATTIWTKHARKDKHHDSQDWMMLGLNTWPGNLARFWTFEISRAWKIAGESWAGLDAQEKQAITRMATTKLSAGDGPRAIFGSELYFLFGADSDFTVRVLFPLFTEQAGKAAMQAWQGYLYHPRVSNRMIELGFLEIVRAGRSIAVSIEGHGLADQYFSLLASICSYTDISGEGRTEILNELVLDGGEDQTLRLIHALVQQLSHAENDEAAGQVWAAWVADFYRKRMDGVPREPTAKELAAWADLVLLAGTGLPEAVDIMLLRPVSLEDRIGLMRLDDTKAKQFPQQLVRYLQHRVDGTTTVNVFAQHYLQTAVRSLARSAGKAALEPVVNKLTTLGAAYAGQWLEELDKPD